jgi:putative phosphoribosyl transferase
VGRREDDRGEERPVTIVADGRELPGDLGLPPAARGLVIFAHGSGSSRLSPRNRAVAATLRGAGLATLLFDLLTAAEEREEMWTRHLRFDIDLLARRLVAATRQMMADPATAALPVGYFGASTGAAAALVAAAALPEVIHAVVSRGGRPDLAVQALDRVRAPVLLIVGGNDPLVLDLNRQAMAHLHVPHRLEVIPGATHLFEEPGALERVAELARDWFLEHLPQPAGGRQRAAP